MNIENMMSFKNDVINLLDSVSQQGKPSETDKETLEGVLSELAESQGFTLYLVDCPISDEVVLNRWFACNHGEVGFNSKPEEGSPEEKIFFDLYKPFNKQVRDLAGEVAAKLKSGSIKFKFTKPQDKYLNCEVEWLVEE